MYASEENGENQYFGASFSGPKSAEESTNGSTSESRKAGGWHHVRGLLVGLIQPCPGASMPSGC